MMTNKLFAKLIALTFFALTTVCSGNARAADDTHWEVKGSANVDWYHVFGTGGNAASNTFAVAGTANYILMPSIEVGVLTSFNYSMNTAPDNYSWVLAAGPTFNFLGDNIYNTFFAEAKAGFQLLHGNGGEGSFTSFYYLLGAGHRFPIIDHVSWNPEVEFSGYTSSTDSSVGTLTSHSQISLIPIQISVFF